MSGVKPQARTSQLFARYQYSHHRTLIVYSDMRQSTGELSIENKLPKNLVTSRGGRQEIPDLHGVQVEIEGVDGTGKSIKYWKALRRFWADCLVENGAQLQGYSALRDKINFDDPIK